MLCKSLPAFLRDGERRVGRRPMNCFWHWMYPNSSRLLVWLARFPSVRSSKFLRVTKSTDSLTIKMDMIPKRALLSKGLVYIFQVFFHGLRFTLGYGLAGCCLCQLYNKSIFLPQYEVIPKPVTQNKRAWVIAKLSTRPNRISA